jgi:hypothetical protein
MNRSRVRAFAPLLAGMALCAACGLSATENAARLQSGTNLKYMLNTQQSRQYLDVWTDATLEYGLFSGTIGYEAHQPPFPGSFDTTGHGIQHYSLAFVNDGLTIRAGTFWTRFGNGLTLNTFEKKDLGWDTHCNGLDITWVNPKFELRAIGGLPSSPAGSYGNVVGGFDALAIPSEKISAGVTCVSTQDDRRISYWSSLYGRLHLSFAALSAEVAGRDFLTRENRVTYQEMVREFRHFLPSGKAFYASADLFVNRFSLHTEGKWYQRFDLSDGAVLNDPPTATREHLFSLQSRKQHTQNANDERGFLVEAQMPLYRDNIAALSFTDVRSIANDPRYRELYGQYELTIVSGIPLLAALAVQQDVTSRYISGGLAGDLPLPRAFSIKGEFQHMHTRIDLTQRMFFDQSYLLGISHTSGAAVSAVCELTSDQTERAASGTDNRLITRAWFGIEAVYRFLENHELTLFAGARREGKICAGGVCVHQPELRGIAVELRSVF